MPESTAHNHSGRRRSLHRAGAALLPVLLLAGGVWFAHQHLSQPGKLPLRVVEVTGEFTHLDHAAIEMQVQGAIDGGFFDVDLQRIRNEVSGMPWVEQVSVRRVWPDTLRMHVSEQVPLAYWNDAALVNLDGEVFRPAAIPALGSLPHLYAEDRRSAQMVAFYLQLQALALAESLRVERVRLNPRGEWSVAFRDGLELMLGRDDIAQRQQAFMDVYPKLLGNMPDRPERIDMRYEHGFAVRWRKQADGES